jgi:hypothetical protein
MSITSSENFTTLSFSKIFSIPKTTEAEIHQQGVNTASQQYFPAFNRSDSTNHQPPKTSANCQLPIANC